MSYVDKLCIFSVRRKISQDLLALKISQVLLQLFFMQETIEGKLIPIKGFCRFYPALLRHETNQNPDIVANPANYNIPAVSSVVSVLKINSNKRAPCGELTFVRDQKYSAAQRGVGVP